MCMQNMKRTLIHEISYKFNVFTIKFRYYKCSSVLATPSAQQKYLSMMLVISEAASISRIIMLLSSLGTVLWNVTYVEHTGK